MAQLVTPYAELSDEQQRKEQTTGNSRKFDGDCRYNAMETAWRFGSMKSSWRPSDLPVAMSECPFTVLQSGRSTRPGEIVQLGRVVGSMIRLDRSSQQ